MKIEPVLKNVLNSVLDEMYPILKLSDVLNIKDNGVDSSNKTKSIKKIGKKEKKWNICIYYFFLFNKENDWDW